MSARTRAVIDWLNSAGFTIAATAFGLLCLFLVVSYLFT